MDRAQKEAVVASFNRLFRETGLVVVTRYSGLTVPEIETLRRQMKDAGASFRVTKNRLTRLALDGTRFKGLAPLFVGPTAIAYSADPVAAAKVAVEFSKKNEKLAIVGGALGEQVLDQSGVSALAALPSLDGLRARLVGLLGAPAQRLASLARAPAGKLARVLAARAEKAEAA